MPGRAGLAALHAEGGGDDPRARQPACPALMHDPTWRCVGTRTDDGGLLTA